MNLRCGVGLFARHAPPIFHFPLPCFCFDFVRSGIGVDV
jgi:hypothetical protein